MYAISRITHPPHVLDCTGTREYYAHRNLLRVGDFDCCDFRAFVCASHLSVICYLSFVVIAVVVGASAGAGAGAGAGGAGLFRAS